MMTVKNSIHKYLVDINMHQYADDTQIFISISRSSATANLHTLESALADLSQWFSLNCLALNPTKSDAILLGTHQRNSTLSHISHINVVGSSASLSDSVKLLGVTLDKSLTFNKHANQVSQSCYYHSDTVSTILLHLLLLSRDDNSNSVLYGAPHYVTHKLPTSSKLSRHNCSLVRQSSPLRTSSTATSLATCSQQNTFQTCHHYI